MDQQPFVKLRIELIEQFGNLERAFENLVNHPEGRPKFPGVATRMQDVGAVFAGRAMNTLT